MKSTNPALANMKNLIGNKVTEKDIRDWLNQNGFNGQVAKITDLKLFAIARPGWKQLFSFELTAKLNSQDEEFEDIHGQHFWGAVLDDERIKNQNQKTQIWLFDSSEAQQTKLAESSVGMVARNRSTDAKPLIFLAIGAAIFLGIVCLLSWLS